MECSSCGFENREASRFCVECGTPLALRCPGCEAEHAPGQRFCGECGATLTGAPRYWWLLAVTGGQSKRTATWGAGL